MSLRGLIASVGGVPKPVVESLVKGEPDYVLFVVSGGPDGSQGQVSERILPELERRLPDYHFQHESCVVSDHENIGTCYREIRTSIEGWLRRRSLEPRDVYIDFTGATKAMSAALTLAAIQDFSNFIYVGGAERTKDSLGTVVTGSEKIVEIQNPWDTYAVRDLERANWLLKRFHADAAAEVLNEAAQKCGPDLKARLHAYSGILRAFGQIDRFDLNLSREFHDALVSLQITLGHLDHTRLESLRNHWQKVGSQVKSDGRTPGRETMLELLANAERRAKQTRFDDAIGRLYRAVELYGQQLVKEAFGAELVV